MLDNCRSDWHGGTFIVRKRKWILYSLFFTISLTGCVCGHTSPFQAAFSSNQVWHITSSIRPSQLPSDVLAPHAEPSHPSEDTHYGCLYPGSQSFGHTLRLIGEGLNVGQQVKESFTSQLSSFFTMTVPHNVYITSDATLALQVTVCKIPV